MKYVLKFTAVFLSLVSPTIAQTNVLSDPPVFQSRGHELDILMIAKPKPIEIAGFNPTAWVYEVCLRKDAIGDACPADRATASPYGGVRLALSAGDHLRIRLVNQLPPAPADAEHAHGEMGEMLAANPTNLHTHGLIVEPRRATSTDPTYGDYVYVLGYPAGKLPSMQDPGLDYTDQPIEYDIYVPKDHASGLFWFHPHAHGLALNQVSSGLAGIITVGAVDDYLTDTPRSGGKTSSHRERYLTLKDMQVLKDGTVLDQEDPDFCATEPTSGESRDGFCSGQSHMDDPGVNEAYAGGKWVFSINGQVYPTIPVQHGTGEVWRITNASGSRAYDLLLLNDRSGEPLQFQVLAVDGVSIDSSGASLNTLQSRLKGRINPEMCAGHIAGEAVCATSLRMFPSSRVEIWVSSRQAEKATSATLITRTLVTGEAGDHWPSAKLAHVIFNGGNDGAHVSDTVTVHGSASSLLESGILRAPVRISGAPHVDEMTIEQARSAAQSSTELGTDIHNHLSNLSADWAGAAPNCAALPPGHHRRIFFGVPASDEDGFGLGYEEVDQDGNPVPGTFQDIAPFNHSTINVCLPLAPGNKPVEEDWELINVAGEDHNFHMHQTKFRVIAAAPDDSETGALVDNVPVPHGNDACDGSIASWRSGACQVTPVLVRIPFSQVGDFVYHCHILEHEDGGMMAHIRVVPN